MRVMKWLLAAKQALWIISLLMLPASALAGRQPNPLPVYAMDNTRHELTFGVEGIYFRDVLYTPFGPRTYRAIIDPVDDCPNGEAGRVVAELRLHRNGDIRWTWTEFLGCGTARLPVLSRAVRRFTRAPRPEKKRCERKTWTFARRKRRLEVTDACDGTLRLALNDQEGDFLVSRKRRGLYDGRGMVMGHPPARWRVRRLRWRTGASRLRISGTLGGSNMRGTWRRQ